MEAAKRITFDKNPEKFIERAIANFVLKRVRVIDARLMGGDIGKRLWFRIRPSWRKPFPN